MIVLLRHLPDRGSLTRKEGDVIKAFEKMANDIAEIEGEAQASRGAAMNELIST